MSYVALYRKWRPKSFEQVKGQEHIVQTLTNQVKANRIGHAYLFCGTRGTGKTTAAKLFAKAINCTNPIDGGPCNECEICKGIENQTLFNVVEIDAASNNGVDNVRQIREEVQYSPPQGKYKVYIIDEVHMLSTSAFNALLKTLEEPPSYVVFILATTEVHKLPVTILSRCQRYDFKRITTEVIAKRLTELMEKEGQSIEDKAINYIAKAADGAMRDALSILDQCISFYIGEELTYDKVLKVIGATDIELYRELLDCIIEQNVSGCIELIERLVLDGKELGQFVGDFTWYFRNLMLVKTAEKADDLVDVSTDRLKLLKEQANRVEIPALLHYINVFSELSANIKFSTQKRILVEIAIIKLCKPETEVTNEAIITRMANIEKELAKGITVVQKSESPRVKAQPTMSEEERAKRIKAMPEEIKEVAKNWHRIMLKLPALTQKIVQTCKVVYRENNGEGAIELIPNNEVNAGMLIENDRISTVRDTVYNEIGKEVNIIVTNYLAEKKQIDISDTIDLKNFINIDIVEEE